MGTSRIALYVVLALFAASPAAAQTDTQRIAKLLTADQHVVVVDSAGRELDGRVNSVTLDSLGLVVDGQTIELPVDDIVKIDHPRDGLGNGAWIGFGIFAGMTATMLAINPVCRDMLGCERPSFPVMVWAVGMTGATGAGIGAGIDALIGRNKAAIYRRGASPRASIAPAIGSGVRGGVVSVTW
jgi:hypothetical protein